MEARLGDPGSDRTTCFHTNCKRLCELHMVERIELVRWEIVDAKNYIDLKISKSIQVCLKQVLSIPQSIAYLVNLIQPLVYISLCDESACECDPFAGTCHAWKDGQSDQVCPNHLSAPSCIIVL